MGAGRVGQWFVTKLVREGYEPVVFDTDETALDEAVDSGAVAAESPAAVTTRADVVLLSLPGREAVETVMEGDDGVLDALESGQVVVDTGTTPPDVATLYQTLCRERGAGYLDCGITYEGPGEFDEDSGPAYTMFVGGDEEDYERVRPVVEVLGYGHEFYEGIGNGHVVKAASRLRQTCMAAVAAEVVEFLTDNGIDPGRVVEQLEWDIPEPYLGFEYGSVPGFEEALEADGSDAADRGFAVDDRGARTRLRTTDWANDTAYALDIAHASNTHVPMLTAAHRTQLAAENYGSALLDRRLEFGDPDWHPGVAMLSVYRMLNRPKEELRRLGGRGESG